MTHSLKLLKQQMSYYCGMFCPILLFGDWEIIGEDNEMIRGVSEVLGVNKNSPRYDGE